MVCPLIGFLVGNNFNFGPLKSACLSLVAYISSGNLKVVSALVAGNQVTLTQISGVGDVLNVLAAVSIGAYLTLLIDNKFGALTIVLQPIVVGVFVSWLGLWMYQYVSQITVEFARLIETWTTLQPLLMCILISMAFCFAVASPFSSVALGFITGVTGLASGAANMGVAAAATFLIVGTFRVNKFGVPIAIFFGAIKMMMPNLISKPKLFIPMLALGVVGGVCAYLFGVVGDKATAGFGYISLIGPLKSYDMMVAAGASSFGALTQLVLAYLVVPFGVMIAMHIALLKTKFYAAEDFKFNG